MTAAFRQRFSFEDWFDRFCSDIDSPSPIRRLVLEALSDAGAEQFLNPLAASNLRRYGAAIAAGTDPDLLFWVRSEWEKVDLCYGLAVPFEPTRRGWNSAWEQGKTGDLGQCEAKVCYTHIPAGKVEELAGQLRQRRQRDQVRRSPGLEHLRYHGIVWLFQHAGVDAMPDVCRELESRAETLGLTVLRPFRAPATPEDLGRIWPSATNSSYSCGMAMALLELTG